MFLRWLFWLLILWWAGRLLGRALRAWSAVQRRPGAPSPDPPRANKPGDLAGFTQQEISDADYEEIP